MLSTVLANPPEAAVCEGVAGDCAHTFEGFQPIFLNIVSILIPVGGIVLFVMLIMGGFAFMTSSGDPRKAEGAKSTLTYAIIGVVVLALAFFIIQLIAGFTGVTGILEFNPVVPR